MNNDAMIPRKWKITLWTLQILLAGFFGTVGWVKLSQPIAALTLQMPAMAEFPVSLVRFIGIMELAGAVGLIVPTLIRVMPYLSAWAGLGLATVMALAAGFHVSRGEWGSLPVVLVLGLLAAFVAYGRLKKAPLTCRISGK